VWSFAEHCFKGTNTRSLDFVKVAGACQLRKVFTMSQPLIDDDCSGENAANNP
jgi:hypothetical protein